MQRPSATRARDATGDVEEPAAQALGFGESKLAREHERAQPGEQVLGKQRELEPGQVGFERLERQPPEPQLL